MNEKNGGLLCYLYSIVLSKGFEKYFAILITLYNLNVLSLDEEMQKMRKFPLLNQNKMQDEVCA